MDLFSSHYASELRAQGPLAERVRPQTLDDVAGQRHLIAEGAPLRVLAERKELPSIILWGPPGSGKTTLASVLAQTAGMNMERLSAVDAGVKELRTVLAHAERSLQRGERLLLFIDEIHRFNKAQQDALLHAVERGIVTLIGATTENPSFEVNAALLSRCRVYRLQPLDDADIQRLVQHALDVDPQMQRVVVDDWDAVLMIAGGDARTALNAVESSAAMAEIGDDGNRHITREVLESVLQRRIVRYDKSGDMHYDVISAFIKSMRGSDPDAALFWLAAMIEAGEDPKFIARRMIVFASEDIGNADPQALQLAVAVFQAVERIGMPEARINLAHGVTYLSTAPKSNASYVAIEAALAHIREGVDLTVPLHLRNAPTRLMKDEGYGAGYKYPHDYPGHWVEQQYRPSTIEQRKYYDPDNEAQGGV
jgi:putative ATPase